MIRVLILNDPTGGLTPSDRKPVEHNRHGNTRRRAGAPRRLPVTVHFGNPDLS